VVGLGSWSLLLSRTQVRFPLVPISVGKSIQSKLRTGPPQVGGEIGPLGLVDPWIGYRVLKKKKKKIVIIRGTEIHLKIKFMVLANQQQEIKISQSIQGK